MTVLLGLMKPSQLGLYTLPAVVAVPLLLLPQNREEEIQELRLDYQSEKYDMQETAIRKLLDQQDAMRDEQNRLSDEIKYIKDTLSVLVQSLRTK